MMEKWRLQKLEGQRDNPGFKLEGSLDQILGILKDKGILAETSV